MWIYIFSEDLVDKFINSVVKEVTSRRPFFEWDEIHWLKQQSLTEETESFFIIGDETGRMQFFFEYLQTPMKLLNI